MRLKKSSIFLLGTVVVLAVAFRPQPDDKQTLVMKLIMQGLNTHHYLAKDLDDEFSSQAFDLYLERLDYGKRFLTQKDVEDLRKYRFRIDDEVRDGSHTFLDKSYELIQKRVAECEPYFTEILSKPLDYSAKETLETDPEKIFFANDVAGLKDRWRKTLKFQIISKVDDLLEEQEQANEKGNTEPDKTFAEFEVEARERILKNTKDWFTRISKQEYDDYQSAYVNAIVGVFDPHTSFFPPKDKEDFDIRMSGRLEGIGATLTEKDGYIKVEEIVTGSPSWKQGELQAGDMILKVAQGAEEPVDIVDMRLDKAVTLIRGPKGTEVRLTIKKIDGEIKTISIIRDIVILEETYAKSAIITREGDNARVGYIYLPKFYVDFTKTGGRSCSEDVANEISKLKAEGVDAIVLDLRNNSGGSLNDVVKMTGFFIEKGPIVQVKSRSGDPYVLDDKDSRVQYDGPLAVMVNSGSASASEILAAAIQDYRRGIIVGTPTFGKGTVQRFFDLDQMAGYESEAMKPLGSIKLTTQKFYRVNGGATQLRGVTPDVFIPDPYIFVDRGEKEQDLPMPWDEIKSVAYDVWHYTPANVKTIVTQAEARIGKNPAFTLQQENAQWLKANRDETEYSLAWDAYRTEEEKSREEGMRFKNNMKDAIPGFHASVLKADQDYINADTARKARSEDWISNLQKDRYLEETMNVLSDMKVIDLSEGSQQGKKEDDR